MIIQHSQFILFAGRMVSELPPNALEVIKCEEEGSDVNLAVQLLNDTWLGAYDFAIVVSNDSDMTEAMRLIKLHHPAKIDGLINPVRENSGRQNRALRQLSQHADFMKTIRNSAFASSQLPNPIPETNIHKPLVW